MHYINLRVTYLFTYLLYAVVAVWLSGNSLVSFSEVTVRRTGYLDG